MQKILFYASDRELFSQPNTLFCREFNSLQDALLFVFLNSGEGERKSKILSMTVAKAAENESYFDILTTKTWIEFKTTMIFGISVKNWVRQLSI